MHYTNPESILSVNTKGHQQVPPIRDPSSCVRDSRFLLYQGLFIRVCTVPLQSIVGKNDAQNYEVILITLSPIAGSSLYRAEYGIRYRRFAVLPAPLGDACSGWCGERFHPTTLPLKPAEATGLMAIALFPPAVINAFWSCMINL